MRILEIYVFPEMSLKIRFVFGKINFRTTKADAINRDAMTFACACEPFCQAARFFGISLQKSTTFKPPDSTRFISYP